MALHSEQATEATPYCFGTTAVQRPITVPLRRASGNDWQAVSKATLP